jgi:mono/diheme cytochrome c family protein
MPLDLTALLTCPKGEGGYRVYDSETLAMLSVLNGLQGKAIGGINYASSMPAFAAQLADEEIAAVINHERASGGHKAPLVTTSQITALR